MFQSLKTSNIFPAMDFTSNKIYSPPDIKNVYSYRYESLVYLNGSVH